MKYSKDVIHISVTIVCAALVAITAIIAAFVARERVTTYEYREVPSFDGVEVSDYFPLAVGNCWTYKGTAANALAGSSKIIEKEVSLTMSVQNVINERGISLYMLEGHPSDAAWALKPHHMDEDIVEIPQGKYGYLVVSNKIFHIDDNQLDEVIGCMREDGYLKEDVISQNDLEFEFPLFKDQRFGELCQIGRHDLQYFWYVNDRFTFHEPRAGSVTALPIYQLVHNSFSGYVQIEFSPYLGILSYEYVHHGTVCEVHISLSDYEIHLDK